MTDTTPVLCASDHCRPPAHGGPRRAERGSPICRECEDRAWDDAQTIARVYPSTEAQLTAPVKGGDGTGIRGARQPGLDLNPRVVEARADITNTLTFWTHLLIDEHPTLTTPGNDPSAMARFIGANLRHLTHHHDDGIALSIVEDTRRLARLVVSVAYPKGARRYEPGIPCVEHDTNDLGERVPCAGEYGAWVWDGMGQIPDLTCNADATHVLTPAGFRTLGRTVLHMGNASRLLEAVIGKAG